MGIELPRQDQARGSPYKPHLQQAAQRDSHNTCVYLPIEEPTLKGKQRLWRGRPDAWPQSGAYALPTAWQGTCAPRRKATQASTSAIGDARNGTENPSLAYEIAARLLSEVND